MQTSETPFNDIMSLTKIIYYKYYVNDFYQLHEIMLRESTIGNVVDSGFG